MIYDFLVIGGGISGASVAYELAKDARVLLLEAETSPGYHSTGRSAALFTRNYGGPVVRRINIASAAFFGSPPPGFCQTPLLSPRGSLTVAAPGQEADLEPLLAMSERGEDVNLISAEETLERVPFLRPDRVSAAAFEPGVADIDVASLHQGYLKGYKSRGGDLQTSARVLALSRKNDLWQVETATNRIEAGVVINATGAWAGQIGQLAGARLIGLTPKRRTAIIIDAPDTIDTSALPAIDFAGSEVYIKPDAGKLMASPGDQTPCAPQDARPEEMDIAVLVDWIQRETLIDVRRVHHSWAGLRSFVSDEVPVVGFDPLVKGFFWLAGQGGYGVMMAPALARQAAHLCLNKDQSSPLVAVGVNADSLSPDRPL